MTRTAMCTRILEVQEWQVREWVARAPQPHLETAVPCGVDGTTWSASSTLTSSASVPARPRRREARPHRSGRGAASASASARCSSLAATGGQHRGINVSRQARKQLLVGSSTATCARARARSLSLRSPRRRQGPSLFLYCALTLSDNHTRRPQTPPPPAAHYHSSSRFRSFLLSSSLTLWLTGSLTQGRSKDGIEIDLTGQSSDTQRLVLKAALTISDQLCLIN